MKIEEILEKYPNIKVTDHEDRKTAVLGAMESNEGTCPCQLKKCTCLTCKSVEKVDRGERSACTCGLFVYAKG